MRWYADDLRRPMPDGMEQAQAALAEVRTWGVEENGLTLHPDKTHVGNCRIEVEGRLPGYRRGYNGVGCARRSLLVT